MPRKKSNKVVTYSDEAMYREASKPFKKYYSLEKYDRTLRDYRDRLKTNFSRAYDNGVETAKRKLNETSFRVLKTEGAFRKRRIAAYVDTAVLFAEKFEDKYPNINIESEFCDYSSAISAIPPDYLEEKEYMTLAAALFILDAVKKSGNFYSASFYIPDNDETEKVDLPFEFQDSVFSNDIIQGVIYLIKNRHGSGDGDTYYSKETAAITPDDVKFCEYRKYGHENLVNENSKILKNDDLNEEFTGRYIRYYEKAEKMSLQEKYYALISFIRPEIIERAVQRFRDISYELADIILGMASQSRGVRVEIAEKSKVVIDSLIKTNTSIAENRKRIENQLKQDKGHKTALNVLTNRIPDDSQIQRKLAMISDMSTVMDKYDSVKDEIDSLIDSLIDESVDLKCRFDMIRQWMTGRIDKAEDEAVRNLKILNPYEIIFGFLYLIDSGDSLVWITQLAECVCGYAVQLLPWVTKNTDVLDDLIEERYERESEADETDDDDIPAYQKYVDDDSDKYEDEYTLRYNDAFMFAAENLKAPKNSLIPYNLAQVIYTDSNVVSPRYDEDADTPVQGFVKSGFTRKQAEVMQYYKAFAEAHNSKFGFEAVNTTKHDIDEILRDDSRAQSDEDLKKVISAKNEEIEALKKELYAAKKKASDSENKISVMKEEHASDLQELLELRDLVYKIQNSSGEEEVKQESSVSFPYRTNARVVVYGGHATWLKVIVKLLPNVKFIDPYADPDVNTIRNADIVWMQTNAMPHNKYNKIMEIVRMKKIPVKYFAYASAEKCAVQLAEYDRNEEK